jgi:hypothetical protein
VPGLLYLPFASEGGAKLGARTNGKYSKPGTQHSFATIDRLPDTLLSLPDLFRSA